MRNSFFKMDLFKIPHLNRQKYLAPEIRQRKLGRVKGVKIFLVTFSMSCS